MEATLTLKLPVEVAEALVAAFADRHDEFNIPLTLFDGQPTSMLIPPSMEEGGSTHYMFFPVGSRQRTHCHPSVRYVIILPACAIDVGAAPPSEMGATEPPLVTTRLGAGEVTALRIAPYEWHRFSVPDHGTTGVVAFTVHGDDSVDAADASAELMEEVTIFWEPTG